MLGRELEGEEAGAAADVERSEPTTGDEHEIQDAVPRGPLGGGADAVAEVFEVWNLDKAATLDGLFASMRSATT